MGVGHGARCTACSFNGRAFFAIASSLALPSRQSRLLGVAQQAVFQSPAPFPVCGFMPLLSVLVGVGHEPQPLPDVRRPDARSAQISRPDGVTRTFQVIRNKVKPLKGSLACNFLSKDD